MKTYEIIAYADSEYGLPRRTATVIAKDRNDALNQGWRIFPEYHEINACEVT